MGLALNPLCWPEVGGEVVSKRPPEGPARRPDTAVVTTNLDTTVHFPLSNPTSLRLPEYKRAPMHLNNQLDKRETHAILSAPPTPIPPPFLKNLFIDIIRFPQAQVAFAVPLPPNHRAFALKWSTHSMGVIK